MLKKYKLLDPITAEDCAISLSRTKHWKLGVELLPNIKILGNPTRGCLLNLVEAAFRNHEYQMGWDLLNGNRIDQLQTDGELRFSYFYQFQVFVGNPQYVYDF